MADARLRDRVVHVRSFSKSLGPDLRIAVAAVGGVIRDALIEERSYADGWTSVFAQRSLAAILAAPGLGAHLASVAAQYRANRRALVTELTEWLPSMNVNSAAEGLHVWLSLPDGVRSDAVVETAARAGFLVADGEPFFLDPGRRDFIRINAGACDPVAIPGIARGVGEAIERSVGRGRVLLSP
jgi:GntR family transcriptional regulator/MocR family aminotransferase